MANITASKSKTLSIDASSSDSSKYTLLSKLEETSVDSNNNKSTIKVTASISNKSYSFSGTSCTLEIWWYDNNSYSSGKKVATTTFSRMSANTTKTVSGSINVAHKSDGTLSGYALAKWVRSSANSYCPASSTVQTNSTALKTNVLVSFDISLTPYDSFSINNGGKLIANVSQVKATLSNISDTSKVSTYNYTINGYSDIGTTINNTTHIYGNEFMPNTVYGATLSLVNGGSVSKGIEASDFINYHMPVVSNIRVTRPNSTLQNISVTFTANIWYGAFGSLQNNTIVYKIYNLSGTLLYTSASQSITSASKDFTYTGLTSPIDSDNTFYIEITDKASTSLRKQFVVPRSISVYDVGEKFFNFNVDTYWDGYKYNPMFRKGETYQVEYVAGGYLTTSNKAVCWSLPLPKSCKNRTISVVSSKVTARCNNAYIIGSASADDTTLPVIEDSSSDYMINFKFSSSSSLGGTNNTAVGIRHIVTLKFN